MRLSGDKWHNQFYLTFSNTLEGGACIETLEEALRQGKPESFNTDQGPRFTRPGAPTRLQATGPRPRSLWKPPGVTGQ